MKSHNYKTILWDNDGVLVDTEHLYYRSNKEILDGVGVVLDEEIFSEFNLVKGRSVLDLARSRGLSNDDIAKLRVKRDARYTELLTTEEFAVEGVERVLEALSESFSMGVVTSSMRVHYEQIHEKTGFRRFFDFELVNEDYTKSKPHPEPYLTALARACSRAEHCLVIEDTARGLAAAKAAGIACWVLPNALAKRSSFDAADRILADISDVAALLVQ